MMTTNQIINLFIILVCTASLSTCQLQQVKQDQSNTTQLPTTITSDKLNTTTTTTPITTTTSSPKEEVLISGEEFVDFTETPTLLFDGTAAENNGTSNNTILAGVESPPSITSSPTQVPSKNATSTTDAVTLINADEPSVNGSISTNTTEPPVSVGEAEEAEELEEDDENQDGSKGDTKPTFTPPQNVSQYMDYIERLFHDLRHQITDLFEPHIPRLIRTSQMVQLSGSCSYDMLLMALALRRFEPWALRMIDSSGKVPEGIFEGSFTALGSYDECLGTVFAQPASAAQGSSQQQQQLGGTNNQAIISPTQGKYCLVNVSPFLPPKPPADRVERMFQEEANRRNYTKDDQFSRLSPMFYYMQFRIGICIPSSCVDSDLDSISSALSSSLRLNITIPHCRVAESQPVTMAQLVGGLVFTLVVATVVVATLMDYTRQKLHRLRARNLLLSGASSRTNGSINKLQQSGVILSTSTDPDRTLEGKLQADTFSARLDRHWSWMSFSLLTNYKLYFRRKIMTFQRKTMTTSTPTTKTTMKTPKAEHLSQIHTPNSMIVRCLDGIRVLSLCWVIVANSYITLDPRATKRLTMTREAPKDFLFQMVAQASLAIETFFFLSGILLSLSFARKLNKPDETKNTSDKVKQPNALESSSQVYEQHRKSQSSQLIRWVQFYVHRYVRMTPATMLVIAFTMFAFRFGDGPLWFEATHKAHMSCARNWWRHLLHVANYIDTRQMCFIHYWYISADMQLFLFAPILMFLLYRYRRIGYALVAVIGLVSSGSVFYTTYMRNLPPTLLFYNSDPESRREFGNTIMTKPLTHALPYMVGMLVGKWLTTSQVSHSIERSQVAPYPHRSNRSVATLLGLIATLVALSEVFLPYKWNNSQLPTRFLASAYAALFRLGWSLVLAYVVISCRHKRSNRCVNRERAASYTSINLTCNTCACSSSSNYHEKNGNRWSDTFHHQAHPVYNQPQQQAHSQHQHQQQQLVEDSQMCMCGYGGSLLNRLLSLTIFTHLSKLSFVAYLIHLPLMSVFIAQTRGLFAFSHTLVIHLALSYLVMTFVLSFLLVHLIEFPFMTFERYLFDKLFYGRQVSEEGEGGGGGASDSGRSAFRTSDDGLVERRRDVAGGEMAKQVIINRLQEKKQQPQVQQMQQQWARESLPTSHGSENLRLSERL